MKDYKIKKPQPRAKKKARIAISQPCKGKTYMGHKEKNNDCLNHDREKE